MNKSTPKAPPSHVVYANSTKPGLSRRIKVGAMWPHRDGQGFNITIDLGTQRRFLLVRAMQPKI
jgi:hypothetical protein